MADLRGVTSEYQIMQLFGLKDAELMRADLEGDVFATEFVQGLHGKDLDLKTKLLDRGKQLGRTRAVWTVQVAVRENVNFFSFHEKDEAWDFVQQGRRLCREDQYYFDPVEGKLR
jgi:hypothetical protein